MSFRLNNAPAVLIDLINSIFTNSIDLFVVVFIDDILIYSKTKGDHVNHFRIALQTLTDAQLYDKCNKCEFWLKYVSFLVHIMSSQGIKVD